MNFCLALVAQDATNCYISGNEAYKQGDYSTAIEQYSNSVAAGACDQRLFYNLGNAYFRDGQIGRAILSLERARFLAPRNVDIQNNLDFIRKTRVDVILDSEDRKPVADVYENTPLGVFYKLLGKFTFNEFILAFALMSALGSLSIFFVFILRRRGARAFRVLAVAFWALAIVFLIPYAIKRSSVWETDKAIILSERAELRSEPTRTSQLKYTLKEGMEVALLETRGDYSRAILRNGEDGWLPNPTFERVIPPK